MFSSQLSIYLFYRDHHKKKETLMLSEPKNNNEMKGVSDNKEIVQLRSLTASQTNILDRLNSALQLEKINTEYGKKYNPEKSKFDLRLHLIDHEIKWSSIERLLESVKGNILGCSAVIMTADEVKKLVNPESKPNILITDKGRYALHFSLSVPNCKLIEYKPLLSNEQRVRGIDMKEINQLLFQRKLGCLSSRIRNIISLVNSLNDSMPVLINPQLKFVHGEVDKNGKSDHQTITEVVLQLNGLEHIPSEFLCYVVNDIKSAQPVCKYELKDISIVPTIEQSLGLWFQFALIPDDVNMRISSLFSVNYKTNIDPDPNSDNHNLLKKRKRSDDDEVLDEVEFKSKKPALGETNKKKTSLLKRAWNGVVFVTKWIFEMEN